MNTHNREQISYNPFGEVRERQYCTDNTTPDARLKYIGKQMDFEMNLADHGVRKYDNFLGQFTSIDPMWEKYYGWSPYHYCRNNPLMAVDPSGMFEQKGGKIKTYNSSSGWADVKTNKGTLISVGTETMNCVGFAFIFCNGNGPKEYDATKKGTQKFVMGLNDVNKVIKDEGYSEPKTIDPNNSESTKQLKEGDVIVYYVGPKKDQAVHASVVKKVDAKGNVTVTEVQDYGRSESVTQDLKSSISDQKTDGNSKQTITVRYVRKND